MALIRLAYAADLPTPEEALRKLAEAGDGAARRSAAASPAGGPARQRRAAALRRPRAAAPRLPRASRPARRRSGWRALRMWWRWPARSATSRCAGAGARCAARPLRARQHCVLPGRGRLAALAQTSRQTPSGLDRRALDGRPGRGRRRPDLAARAAIRAKAERANGVAAHPVVRKVMERFQGRGSSTCARRNAAGPGRDASDDDVGYAETPVSDRRRSLTRKVRHGYHGHDEEGAGHAGQAAGGAG